MNYNDVLDEAIAIEKRLEKIEKIISQLKICKNSHIRWYSYSFDLILNNTIRGNDARAVSRADNLKNTTSSYYKSFIQSLTSTQFMDLWIMIGEIGSDNKSVIGISKFIEVMKESYQIIHEFINTATTENIGEKYIKTIQAIDNMINEYDKINHTIDIVKQVNQMLNIGIEESDFTIRLLTENNILDNTLGSLNLIKAMYNVVCSIINISIDEQPLKYKRIESGSMLLFLAGNAVALGILGKIINFSYNVYKEQFSWKARQEKVLGEIKVRKEYLRLIKECKEEGIEITMLPEQELQPKLAELEDANIELFKNNPHILLNNKDIGIPELENKRIPDKFFLESAIDQIGDEN